jgi:hypothetical protein
MGGSLLLAADAVWLGLLGVGALALRRELGLMRQRVSMIGDVVTDGPEPGAPVPRGPGMRQDRLLLFLSGDCEPCHEVVGRLVGISRPDAVHVVIRDGAVPNGAALLVESLPGSVHLITGEDAERLVEAYGIQTAPTAIATAAGVVRAKGYLRGREDLELLLEAIPADRP